MTRPDDVYGTTGHPSPQWTQPYAGQSFASPALGAQPPYQAYGSFQPQQTYQPQQAFPQQYPAYPTPQYADAWGGQNRPFPPAPMAPQPPRRKPSAGKLVALALAGFLLVGLLGGAVLYITGSGPTAGTPPFLDTADAPVVTMSLPQTIDGKPQIDNEYSRQLVDAARQQLASVTENPVVGMYGDAGQAPAFVVIAGTTSAGSPDLVLTGMAAGFQQSLGSTELEFVDQPAGPLGGTMRCAEHAPMTTCMWSVEGAFGMNMVFQQDLAQGAATTLRVREAIETHTTS